MSGTESGSKANGGFSSNVLDFLQHHPTCLKVFFRREGETHTDNAKCNCGLDDAVAAAKEKEKGFYNTVGEMNDQLRAGRAYLMEVNPDKLTIEDALEAFGFGRNGLGG